jgi:hypothetical protein
MPAAAVTIVVMVVIVIPPAWALITVAYVVASGLRRARPYVCMQRQERSMKAGCADRTLCQHGSNAIEDDADEHPARRLLCVDWLEHVMLQDPGVV